MRNNFIKIFFLNLFLPFGPAVAVDCTAVEAKANCGGGRTISGTCSLSPVNRMPSKGFFCSPASRLGANSKAVGLLPLDCREEEELELLPFFGWNDETGDAGGDRQQIDLALKLF